MQDFGLARRQALKTLAGGIMMAGLGGAVYASTDPVVETTLGKVRGTAGEGHIAFRGIRYARAERFMAPQAPAPHAGTADATRFGAIAPQTNPAPAGPPPIILAHLPRPEGAPAPPRPEESEDCLFLNVWTSSIDRQARRPVMVNLHGGFFYSGSGAMGDGSRISARGDVVAVSLNHRLNAFGFAHLDDIAGKDFAHSGSIGMLDIVAALEWVRDNIEAFGGDPKRVMVYGASGGGMKTGWLLASPRARGLYARAGVQSGPILRAMERDRASKAAEMLLFELGLPAARASELRTLPVEALLGAYYRVVAKDPPKSFTDLSGFCPVLDPELLPHHPFDPVAPAQARDTPLLIGSNAEEMSFFAGNDPAVFTLDEAGLTARTEALLGGQAGRALTLYRGRYPNLSPSQLYLRLFSDQQIMAPTSVEADRRAAAGGAPVFAYHFEWPSPLLGGRLGATHTLESALILNQTAAPLIGGGAGSDALARQMGDAWASFAANGTPGGEWTAYGNDRATMRINGTWRLEKDPFAEEIALLAPAYR